MLIVAAVLILILQLKINLIIEAREKRWTLSVRALNTIIIQRRYELRREFGELLTLYSVDKNEKRILSLTDILRTLKESDKTKSNEKARGKLFKFINKKAKYTLTIQLNIGFDDAFATAMICGIVASALNALKVFNVDKRHHVSFHVQPEYSKSSFSFFGDCIITLSLTNIIIGYIIYKKYKRR